MTPLKQSEAMKRANEQRKLMNPYEIIVKGLLEKHGFDFRWQKVFFLSKNSEKYRIVDFYLPFPLGIIIEVDGSAHMNKSYDTWKDKKISEKLRRIKVLRYKTSIINSPFFESILMADIKGEL